MVDSSSLLSIRPARKGEAALVLQFIRELAEYEKLLDECVATEAMIDAALFGEVPRAFCDIAEWDGAPVGFALWYLTFSTFSGKSGLYLEDLFVRPEHRGKGIGKALMIHLARKCAKNDCDHFQWAVLDWNTPSIDFYKSLGAEMLDQWTGVRVSGAALARLAERP
jgi:GNAT superfamily N-acetyltransferase